MAQKPNRQLNRNEAELEALARIAKPKLYRHTANIAGFHRSRTLINGGTDYAGLREYSPGDEARAINWRASARSSQFQVQQFQQERGSRWFICLDTSTSMRFPEQQKWLQALRICDALAYILISAGSQLGLLTFNESVDHFCPLGHGRQHYKKLHQLLDQLSPRTKGGNSSLQVCSPYIKQQNTVIIISDFLQTDFMKQGMDKLYKSGHHLQVIQIISPLETQLPADGPINLTDCESGALMHIESTSENQFRAQQALNRHCQALTSYCAQKRINYSLAYTNKYWKDVLVKHISNL